MSTPGVAIIHGYMVMITGYPVMVVVMIMVIVLITVKREAVASAISDGIKFSDCLMIQQRKKMNSMCGINFVIILKQQTVGWLASSQSADRQARPFSKEGSNFHSSFRRVARLRLY